jgi:hypothetical protein
MTILKRLFLILLAAAAFGAAMAVLKGNGSGIRDDIGNLSAPWLLLPFAAGAALRGGVLAGAAAGLAGTFAALAAFNLANAFVLDLGPHSTVASIQLTFTVYWFWRGLLSGPLFGALGAVWRARGMPAWGLAVILLLDAEPLFWAAVRPLGGVANFAFAPAAAVSLGEAMTGVVACLCAVAALQKARSRP